MDNQKCNFSDMEYIFLLNFRNFLTIWNFTQQRIWLKNSNVDVWQGSKYVSAETVFCKSKHKCLVCGKRSNMSKNELNVECQNTDIIMMVNLKTSQSFA